MKTKNRGYRFIIPIGILALAGLWFFKSEGPYSVLAYILLGAMILIASLQLYFANKAFQNERSGLTPEDELSKRVREKAAANAFKISVYMWTFIILFFIDMDTGAKIILGLGLIGMGLTYLISWLYL